MSYQDKAAEMGRIPFEFIEVEIDRCNLTFGQGACSATGEPCYNTWATCKAKTAFDKGSFVYRFTTARSDIPVGFDCVPLLQSITYAPQQLTPGKGLGVRGAVSLRFDDAPWPDQIFDPYFNQRPQYDDGLGSFWGKWLARHKYYLSRSLKVFTGYLVNNQIDLAHFKSRAYILEKITGADKNGAVTITAKDILKLADDDKAKCPRATNAKLDADIDAVATTFDVYPTGVGDLEFDTAGFLRISNEVMLFTRSADTFTVTRGQYGTAGREQKIDSTVQQATIFMSLQIQDIIYNLLVDYAKIPSIYINKFEWDAERNAHLTGVYGAIITEPVGVNTLLAELCEQGQCYIWWDEVAQKIRFKALVPPVNVLPLFNDDNHFLANSITANLDVQSRTSRFIVYFDLIDPTKKLDESSNYRQRHIGADLQSESDVEYGTPKSKIIHSRWYGAGSLGRVQQLSTALLERYRDPPRLFDFELDAVETLKTGDYFNVSSRLMQKANGENDIISMQVTEMQENKVGSIVRYKASELIFTEQVNPPFGDVVINGDVWDLNLHSIYLDEFGVVPTSGTVTFYIVETAFVCSTSAYRPQLAQQSDFGDGYPTVDNTIQGTPEISAIDTGFWPDDVTVVLKIGGKVIGRGGDGAIAQSYRNTPSAARNGYQGAPAILNRHSKLEVIVESTAIVARGGSGGGAGAGWRKLITGDYVNQQGVCGGGGAPYGGSGMPYRSGSNDYMNGILIPTEDPTFPNGYLLLEAGGIYVDRGSIATRDVAGEHPIYENTQSGRGGSWGGLGEAGQQHVPQSGSEEIAGYFAGAGGVGGAAIVGVAPESLIIETGGQLLETL